MQKQPLIEEPFFSPGAKQKDIKAYILQNIRQFLNVPREIPEGGKRFRNYLKSCKLSSVQAAISSQKKLYDQHFGEEEEFTTHKLYDWAEHNGKIHGRSILKKDKEKVYAEIRRLLDESPSKARLRESLMPILRETNPDSFKKKKKQELSRKTVDNLITAMKQYYERNEAEDETQPALSFEAESFELKEKPARKGRKKNMKPILGQELVPENNLAMNGKSSRELTLENPQKKLKQDSYHVQECQDIRKKCNVPLSPSLKQKPRNEDSHVSLLEVDSFDQKPREQLDGWERIARYDSEKDLTAVVSGEEDWLKIQKRLSEEKEIWNLLEINLFREPSQTYDSTYSLFSEGLETFDEETFCVHEWPEEVYYSKKL